MLKKLLKKLMLFRKYFTELNIVFLVELLVVSFTVLGFLPREIFLFLAGLLIFFVAFKPYEESVLLIARSIPLFVALPITESFDSLNTWRIVVLVLFLKWFFDGQLRLLLGNLQNIAREAQKSFFGSLKFIYQNWKIEFLMVLLFLISVISLIKAEHFAEGVKRIIYFTNLAMLFFIARFVTQKIGLLKIASNVLISGIIIVSIGFLQLFLAYIMPINDFAELWALQVDKALYGTAWAEIAIRANTWFAYYNDTIHLRVFSSFPDTHSFPLYLLMVSVFTSTLIFKKIISKGNFKPLFLFLVSSFFAIILSGTRGIWASFIFPVFPVLFWHFKKIVPKEILRMITMGLLTFLVLLPLSAPLFSSKQFKLESSETETLVFVKRMRSIIDTEEVSNKGRIYIWQESVKSIFKNPVLGVGIGNFPVVLKENISATKAGASAHNLYLNIAAELGIFGFIIFIFILYEILKKAWGVFKESHDTVIKLFSLTAFVYIIWILGYSMTDVAIFDERAFLMLMILLGVLFSYAKKYEQSAGFN